MSGKIADVVTITGTDIIVDGESFPFALSNEPIQVEQLAPDLSLVTLRVYTKHVDAKTGGDLEQVSNVTTYRSTAHD